ncbi:MAG: ribosome-associated translation inhibitor RaiA [Acidobacteria bacterium]|nr:MAG: ribosome-associated translation inhibitor RaiA [Acidobacteriota bacterium]
MSLDITGRHIEITEPLRKFATDRFERLRGIIDEVLEVHFILTVEKHQRHIAEMNIKTRRDFYHGQEVSTDMYTSIAAVLDKVEKQILKDKGRNVTRKRRNNHHGGEVITTTSVVEVEAVLGERLPRIIRTHEIAAKPMSVDDAAVEIGGSDREFLVFRNAETERLNVVYKRKDGNIGWIEPEA